MTNLYGLPTPKAKQKPNRPSINLLQKEAQSLGNYLLDQPMGGICKTPSQIYGVSPWEECEQPLNRLYTEYERTPKCIRPKSVNNRKQFNVSERLYKPWKYIPIKGPEQSENSYIKNTIDLGGCRAKQMLAALIPLHVKYVSYKFQTLFRNEKPKEESKNIPARPHIGVKINKAKLLSKTSMRFYTSKNTCKQLFPYSIGASKIIKSHAAFLDTCIPLAKISLSDTLKSTELFSRLIKERIRTIQRKKYRKNANM
jgi:hypothetical protein